MSLQYWMISRHLGTIVSDVSRVLLERCFSLGGFVAAVMSPMGLNLGLSALVWTPETLGI